MRPDGVTSFALIQNASDRESSAALVYFVFDLLHRDGRNLMPLADWKSDLATLLERGDGAINYSDHQVGQGPAFHKHACASGLEGIVSKRSMPRTAQAIAGSGGGPNASTARNLLPSAATNPEGSRPFISMLLLAYYDQGSRLIYDERVGTGMRADQLANLLRRLRPL